MLHACVCVLDSVRVHITHLFGFSSCRSLSYDSISASSVRLEWGLEWDSSGAVEWGGRVGARVELEWGGRVGLDGKLECDRQLE